MPYNHDHNPKSLKLLMFQNLNLTIVIVKVIGPILKGNRIYDQQEPFFRLTPPASFTLIGRVCHSSESFAKNEQRLLFSPTNLCQVRLVSLIYSFVRFFSSHFLAWFLSFLSSPPPLVLGDFHFS